MASNTGYKSEEEINVYFRALLTIIKLVIHILRMNNIPSLLPSFYFQY